jgi:hypothetical protein
MSQAALATVPAIFDDVDNDTLAAIQAVWASDNAYLPQYCPQPPRVQRLKEPIVPAGFGTTVKGYVGVEFVLESRDLWDTGGTWRDVRRITLKGYGVKAVAQAIGQGMLALFNRLTVLSYPSTDPTTNLPRFYRWWPEGGVTLKEDDEVKVAQDIWRAELVALVTSIRPA